ncbi:cupin domain-containing protein [Halorubrum sp. SP3]|uniref:cupin domain-containing protein n=1 Tax=unclassified Halorubrum TaxID=2642239 RepID=UPI0010F4CC2E|nr:MULTISPECIES: cupin domain-containing protein [unclassified Halorubrum]TKX55439.1 cupin domain-containing protein [Halorubrum sp. SP3]TKX70643.1 cupin domain-containing protein [Halorubrum sp. SP9]
MTLDSYAAAVSGLDPAPGEVETAELVVTDDVLVKAFVLGPEAAVDPHEHADATNVFHVVEGEPTVIRDDEESALAAPAVVENERGAVHGARNDTDERAVLTASLAPLP